MKKSAIAIICLAAVGLAACEEGFDDGAPLKPDSVGRIDTVTGPLRVYEFTPRSNLKKQCVFVAGDRKSGLQCWDK